MSKILRNRFGIGSVRNLSNSAERFGIGSESNFGCAIWVTKHGEIGVLWLRLANPGLVSIFRSHFGCVYGQVYALKQHSVPDISHTAVIRAPLLYRETCLLCSPVSRVVESRLLECRHHKRRSNDAVIQRTIITPFSHSNSLAQRDAMNNNNGAGTSKQRRRIGVGDVRI